MSEETTRKVVENSKPTCRVCGKSPTVRSHLIPEGFIREIRHLAKSDEKHMLVRADSGMKIASNTGQFVKNLLCGECDTALGYNEDTVIKLLRRLRAVDVGKKGEAGFEINSGLYEFRVKNVDEIIRFGCGIIWKYASLPESDPSYIDIGDFREVCEEICFHNSVIPNSVDAFLERDLLSYVAMSNYEGVYYYCTPSKGMRKGRFTSWFSVGAFTIYVRLDDAGRSTLAPRRCWLKGRKRCYFNVDLRSIQTNMSIFESINFAKDDLERLGRKFRPPI